MDIGADCIRFIYSIEKWTQNIWLLHPAIDSVTLEQISERFRYETGITPTLLL